MLNLILNLSYLMIVMSVAFLAGYINHWWKARKNTAKETKRLKDELDILAEDNQVLLTKYRKLVEERNRRNKNKKRWHKNKKKTQPFNPVAS